MKECKQNRNGRWKKDCSEVKERKQEKRQEKKRKGNTELTRDFC
jgi:hypothetical protein